MDDSLDSFNRVPESNITERPSSFARKLMYRQRRGVFIFESISPIFFKASFLIRIPLMLTGVKGLEGSNSAGSMIGHTISARVSLMQRIRLLSHPAANRTRLFVKKA